jgi:hypothetical protein
MAAADGETQLSTKTPIISDGPEVETRTAWTGKQGTERIAAARLAPPDGDG